MAERPPQGQPDPERVPGVDIGGRLVPGTGGVLMRADHGAVHTHCPFRPLGLVGVAAELVEQPFPRTVG